MRFRLRMLSPLKENTFKDTIGMLLAKQKESCLLNNYFFLISLTKSSRRKIADKKIDIFLNTIEAEMQLHLMKVEIFYNQ